MGNYINKIYNSAQNCYASIRDYSFGYFYPPATQDSEEREDLMKRTGLIEDDEEETNTHKNKVFNGDINNKNEAISKNNHYLLKKAPNENEKEISLLSSEINDYTEEGVLDIRDELSNISPSSTPFNETKMKLRNELFNLTEI